jgi:hypothetical protein
MAHAQEQPQFALLIQLLTHPELMDQTHALGEEAQNAIVIMDIRIAMELPEALVKPLF